MLRFTLPSLRAGLIVGSVLLLLAVGPARGLAQSSADVTTNEGPSTSVLNDAFVEARGTEGLNHLYDMRFEQAEALFDEIDRRYPNHPVGAFLDGLRLWWTIMLDLTDTSHDEAFYEQMDEVIARCDTLLDEHPNHFDAALFKGAAYGFKARLASNRGSWWKALQNGRKAIGHVRRAAEEAPSENGDYVFGKGLYDYYTAVLEEEYTLAKMVTWTIPDGDRRRGLRLLRQAARDGRYVQTEAIYYLTQVYLLYEEEYTKSRTYVRRLRQRHPKNPFFHVLEGRIYARWGRWDQARRVFGAVLQRREEGQAGYTAHMEEVAHYYLGRERLYRDEHEEALAHLARLQRLAGTNADDKYRVMALLYQGMTYDAMGRRELATKHYREVLRRDDPGGVHDRAERYLDDPYS